MVKYAISRVSVDVQAEELTPHNKIENSFPVVSPVDTGLHLPQGCGLSQWAFSDV
tara:strand:- start:240 stop:404 length:165 start_codon:yes stop_codon:yes gene_type:complete